MRTYTILVVAALACSGPATASAQQSDPAQARASIARLEFMLGRWRGHAWQQRGGERVEIEMTEVVESKLDGTIVVVEGRGTVPDAEGQERVVHHALGVIAFNPSTASYTLRSYLATGQYGDFAVEVRENEVSWTREVPGGRVRNTARYASAEWHEVGEFSRDGINWTRVMEISLKREAQEAPPVP